MASLTIDNIHKRWGSTHVLKGIDLHINDGEFLILVGPSGCGKSTLLSMVAGLDDITDGRILIGDQVVNDISPKDRNIAMVFQSYALYPSMTVRENIEFGLKMKKVSAADRAVITERVAKTLQMEALLDRRPSQLSGGQRQRVAMGRALARSPAIFLFDEPLSNLDAKLRVEMRAEIKALHQRLNTTIVYVTHDQVEAMTLGDKIAVMKDGLVQQFGTPAQIYSEPANMYVAGFIGSPTMNFLNVDAVQANTDMALRLAGLEGAIDSGRATITQKQVVLGIRPEQFQLATADSANSVTAHVQFLEPTGADTFATVSIGTQKAVVRFAPTHAPRVGDTIALTWDASAVCLFDPQSQVRI